MYRFRANPEYLGKGDIQLGKKESVEDTAKVLGRMFDGIEFRGFNHETVESSTKFWCASLEWINRYVASNTNTSRFINN